MKLITPHIVIKKDYLYTSVCIDSNHRTFYLMNKFTVDNEEAAGAGKEENKRVNGMTEIGTERVEGSDAGRSEVGSSVMDSNTRQDTFAQAKSENLYKASHMSQNDKNYFLSE